MKRKITIKMESGRRNFHNAGPIDLIVDDAQICAGENSDKIIPISPGQAKRIADHFCGMKDCTCESGPLIHLGIDPHYLMWAISEKWLRSNEFKSNASVRSAG